EDLQTIKKDLSFDLQDVWRNLDNVRERVAALEQKDAGRNDDLEWLQQEIIRLQEQHNDL
ncbi:hypothetical protein NDU88_009207, partial [Pleurodeles waltl]